MVKILVNHCNRFVWYLQYNFFYSFILWMTHQPFTIKSGSPLTSIKLWHSSLYFLTLLKTVPLIEILNSQPKDSFYLNFALSYNVIPKRNQEKNQYMVVIFFITTISGI
jgi:hypothetical protein